MIEKLGLAGYFLIVWDIVEFCRREKILCQGRGSAANSAVCYALGITAIDPVKMELLFERFLSEERGEWPDIDLDLPSGEPREKVIQYVFRRYGGEATGGSPHAIAAAMTANVITYRDRSAAREVAKALGYSREQEDRLARQLGHFRYDLERGDPKLLERELATAGFDPEEPRNRLFAIYWRKIQNLPRHLGQHSGGMVIAAGRLDEIVPLEPAAMPGRTIVQWDKDDCADLGIIKVDLLGLGMLNALEEAIPIIRDHERVSVDLAHLPADDPRGLRHAARRRHGRRLPGREPRADGLAAEERPDPLLRSGHPGRHHPPGADHRRHGAPVLRAPAGAREGDLLRPLPRADPQAHARHSALPGTAPAYRDDRGRLLRRRGRGAAARHGFQALGRAHGGDRGAAAQWHGGARHHRRQPGPDRAVDHLVRALRLPRVARRLLRAHRLRLGLSQVLPPDRVSHRAAQRLADGLLPPRLPGQGRPAPRRRCSTDRCELFRVAVLVGGAAKQKRTQGK